MISFARGVPAPECLPVAELADCARTVLERDGETALNYGPAAGYGPLREWLAERHGVSPAEILVLNGSLQGLDLLLGRYGSERRVLVEAPTYDRVLHAAARRGLDIGAVPHDEEGIDPDALERELARDRRPALLYLLPTFQNPSGRTISVERRRRVLELAEAHGTVVVEDDPYRLVRFDGEDVASLHELPGGERVVYSSSLSKIVAPGLRVGYLVAPAGLASELERAAASTYLAPAFSTQAIAFEFLRRGLLEANVERVRGLLRLRRDAMLAALERELPDAAWNVPAGGYFLWLELPDGLGARDVLSSASEAGVTFVPGDDFFLSPHEDSGAARLAFSFASPEEIGEGVARLAGVCFRAAV
ncbi:MAG TPA: PLP-dependent aminotransferase family protein [Gaiellaceae bacterium]|nr:PLP-dependent aminotransferase family protein [Gaiellaceae bacterium]